MKTKNTIIRMTAEEGESVRSSVLPLRSMILAFLLIAGLLCACLPLMGGAGSGAGTEAAAAAAAGSMQTAAAQAAAGSSQAVAEAAAADAAAGGGVLAAALLVSAGVILLLSFLRRRSVRAERIGTWLLYAAVIAAALICFGGLAAEIRRAALTAAHMCGEFFHLDMMPLKTEAVPPVYSGVLWCAIAILLSGSLLRAVRERKRLLPLVVFLISLLAWFVLEQGSSWITLVILFAGFLFRIIDSIIASRRLSRRIVFCMLAVSAAVAVLALAVRNYDGSDVISGLREAAASAWDSFRYGTDTLPKGDLTKADKLFSEEDDALRISGSGYGELYLRGFVGCSYEGDRWREYSLKEYETMSSGLLQWMEERDFAPAMQMGRYCSLDPDDPAALLDMQVRNTGAYRKYIYLPSAAASFGECSASPAKDLQVSSDAFFGSNSYSFSYDNISVRAEDFAPAVWSSASDMTADQEDFLYSELNYRHFAEEAYTAIDDDLAQYLSETFFAGGSPDSVEEAIGRVREVLETRVRYDVADIPALRRGDDLIHAVMDEWHTGNDVHFATVACMAFRAAGIPARYAEGYYVPEDMAPAGADGAVAGQLSSVAGSGADGAVAGQLSSAAGSGFAGAGRRVSESATGMLTLTDQNAHAWVEVYLPGAGWMTVEVVPGLYSDSGVPDNSEEISVGASAENGNEAGEGIPADALGPAHAGSILLLILIILCCAVAAVFVILEIRRAVLLSKRRRKSFSAHEYADGLFDCFRAAGIIGNTTHPFALTEELQQKLPEVDPDAYEEVIRILQRIRFGGEEPSPEDLMKLSSFRSSVLGAVHRTRKGLKRLPLRYRYLLEKE